MPYRYRLLLIGAMLFLLAQPLRAQQPRLTGYVYDTQARLPLVAATVTCNDTLQVLTDERGLFQIDIADINSLRVTYLGYRDYYQRLSIKSDDTRRIDIGLTPTTTLLRTLVVTGSNYEKNILQEPTSIEVIQPDYLRNTNTNSLASLMERVPGIQIYDGQASIRSSGFSQGVGSRVAIVVNDLPMLGGEGSDIRWNLVPLENTDQIEVIKGAASVLYGSAAMNGVINVRTAWPTSEPYTQVSIYGGTMDGPREAYRQWWKGRTEAPYNRGIAFAHRQKLGRLDLVLGGNADQTRSHIQGNDEHYWRTNANLRYRLSERLTATLGASFMSNSQMPYLTWQDGDTNVLRPLDSLVANRFYNTAIDPALTYRAPNGDKHILRGRYFNTAYRRFTELVPASMAMAEYQYQHQWGNQYRLSAGASYQHYFARSPNFGRDTATGDFLSADVDIYSLYAQGEGTYLDGRLSVVAGGRLDVVSADQSGLSAKAIPILRLSARYDYTPSQVFRFSIGQGYRFPSLAERYIQRDLVAVNQPPFDFTMGIYPNVDLRPEYGWSAELGYKHAIERGQWKALFDIAAFATRYRDMIYLSFDYHADYEGDFDLTLLFDDPTPLGYRYVNLENTLVSGLEVSTTVSQRIGNVPFRVWAGYTYTYPGNLDSLQARNETYLPRFFKAITLQDSTVRNTLLPYRSRHVVRLDVEAYWRDLTVGAAARLDGYMDNIDPILEGRGLWGPFVQALAGDLLLPGVVTFRENNPRNPWVFDVRAAYDFNDHHRLHLVIQNLFNTTYAFRPGRINPFRTYNLRYTYTF